MFLNFQLHFLTDCLIPHYLCHFHVKVDYIPAKLLWNQYTHWPQILAVTFDKQY